MENKNIKTYAELQTVLQDKKVTGYIWMVSHKKPCIYQDEKIDFDKLKHGTPVFNKIQEVYLYVDGYSIHVKNIDGEELFFVFNEKYFQERNDFEISDDILKFPSHIKDIDYIYFKQIYFKQIYELKPSISSEDFKTYQPIVRLFKGFSNPKNN